MFQVSLSSNKANNGIGIHKSSYKLATYQQSYFFICGLLSLIPKEISSDFYSATHYKEEISILLCEHERLSFTKI